MRKLVLGFIGASALALGSTAANATVAVITCDPTLDNGCSAANPASPAPATISWSDSDVGASPFSGFVDFSNTLSGDYFVSLTTADPNLLFTQLTITPLLGGAAVINYSGGPTNAITLLPGTFGAGNYHLTFGGTTSGGGGEAGTLSFFAA